MLENLLTMNLSMSDWIESQFMNVLDPRFVCNNILEGKNFSWNAIRQVEGIDTELGSSLSEIPRRPSNEERFAVILNQNYIFFHLKAKLHFFST